MSFVALVRRPGYRDLLVGQGVSALGDWMGTVALMALVLAISNSPIAVGGILTLRLLPAAVGGPLAARAAAKWDRRRTMLAMDTSRAAMIAMIPIVRALWWIYLWGFLVEVASIVFLPARDASIPDLVAGDDELPLANGLILGTSYGCIPLGAALFAAVAALPLEIDHRPFALVFFIDAITFLVSFFCITHLTQLGAATAAVDDESDTRFLDAFRIPLVRAVMPAAVSVALGLGALFSLGIVFVHDVLHASDAEFGVLIAMFGVGAVFGLLALQRLPHGDLLACTRFGVAYIGAVIAVFSLSAVLWVAWFGAAAFGAGAAYALSAGMGAIQSRLDGRQRVLAFAAFHVVLRVGLGVERDRCRSGRRSSRRRPLASGRHPRAITARVAVCGSPGGREFLAGPLAARRDGCDRLPVMTIVIVTDSAAAIPSELADCYDVTVVPMWIHAGDVTMAEGERPLGELLGDVGVTTSAPAPGDFEAAIRGRLGAGADSVVVLTITAEMSASHDAATVAARALGDHVRAVDTTTAAGGQALVVLAAARAARAGASLDAVVDEARAVARRVRLLGMVPRLEHLVRSGRVPGLAGWAGRALGINPLFELRDGRVRRLRPAIGSEAAVDRMVARFRRSAAPGARAHVSALHALVPDEAAALLERVEREVDVAEGFVSEFGPVMVVHTGPGLLGLAWWWEPA